MIKGKERKKKEKKTILGKRAKTSLEKKKKEKRKQIGTCFINYLFGACLLACFWGFCVYNNNYCFVPSRASKQARKWLIKISKQFEFKACKLCNMLTYIVNCGTGEWVPITLCNLTNKLPLDRWDGQHSQHNRKPQAYSMMLTTYDVITSSPYWAFKRSYVEWAL